MLLSGWVLSLSRRGLRARVSVIASVPVGGFLGGLGGGVVCQLIFRLQGHAETQHDWIAWGGAAILGAVVGLIVVPTLVLAFTGRKEHHRGVV